MGSLFATYASISATITLLQQAYHQFIPSPLRDRISIFCHRIFNLQSPTTFTLLVEEYHGLKTNPLFESLEAYLCNTISSKEASYLKATTESLGSLAPLELHIAREEYFKETFNGFEIKWYFHCSSPQSNNGRSKPMYASWRHDDEEGKNGISEETRYIELCFLKIHKEDFFASYLPQVLKIADKIMSKDRILRLWTLKYSGYSYDSKGKWESVKLNHPSTFDTLALDPCLKQAIIEDLNRFLGRKEFYRKVGRAWKRGYLLYGPPGTGKSSLIAAIANYLKFDVYDLQLMHIEGDNMLRKLLLSTTNKSILVIEDIDCSMGLPKKRKIVDDQDEDESSDEEDENDNNKRNHNSQGNALTGNATKISLSGLLNFIDGLWTSCGDERIIIFTTNHKERIDPALMRPGRMDFHIHMSYLGMDAFKILASNYLDLDGDKLHPLFDEINEMIKTTDVTPAEIAEELMKGQDADSVLEGVVGFLKRKRIDMEKERVEKEMAKKSKKIKKEEKAKQKVLNVVGALKGEIGNYI